MKSDFKKKFLDILFEPEEPEVTKESTISPQPQPQVKTIDAKEILYQEKPKNSSFINLEEKSSKKKEEVKPQEIKKSEEVKPKLIRDDDKNYVIKDNVSPIFGMLEQKKPESKIVKKDLKSTINPSKYTSNEYIGGIISPIFGYDTEEADKAREIFENENQHSEEVTESDVVDEIDLYETPIDIFEDYEEPYVDETVFEEEVTPLNKYEVNDIKDDTTNDPKELIDDTFEFNSTNNKFDYDDVNDDESDIFEELKDKKKKG